MNSCAPNLSDLVRHPEQITDADLTAIIRADLAERSARGMEGPLTEYLSHFPQAGAVKEIRQLLIMNAFGATATPDQIPEMAEKFEQLLPQHREEIREIALLANLLDQCVDPTRTTAAGQQRGKYCLISLLGRGAFAQTWRALDTILQREVALKIFASPVQSKIDNSTLIREARALARIDHPAVVRVHEVTRFDSTGEYQLEMQLVGGKVDTADCEPHFLTLEFFLEPKNRLTPRQCAQTILTVAKGLAAIHAQGLTHRDIKPANIFLDQDLKPVLGDFGLACLQPQHQLAGAPATSQLAGTPAYMAPEVARCEQASPLSDIYALGGCLQALLIGGEPRPRRDGESLRQYLERVATHPLPPLASKLPHLAQTLAAICDRATAHAPNQRYAAAAEFAADLEAFIEKRPTRARPLNRWHTWWLAYERNFRTATAVAIAVFVVVVGTIYFLISLDRERRAARVAEAETRVQRDTAVAAKELLESQNSFLARTFNSARGQHGLGNQGEKFTVKDSVSLALRRLDTTFPDRPRLQASVLHFLAQIDLAIGEHERAVQSAQRSLAIRQQELGNSSSEAMASRRLLGDILQAQGEDLAAVDVFEQIVRQADAESQLANPDVLWARARLAGRQGKQGDRNFAIGQLEKIAAAYRQLPDNGGMDQQRVLDDLVILYSRLEKLDKAEQIQREIVQLNDQRFGAQDISTLNSKQGLARLLQLHRQVERASEIYCELLPQYRKVLGTHHLVFRKTALEAARTSVEAQTPQAHAVAGEVWRDFQDLAPQDSNRIQAALILAQSLIAIGQIDKAAQHLQDQFAAALATPATRSEHLTSLGNLLTQCLEQLDRHSEAEQVRDSLARRKRGQEPFLQEREEQRR